MTVSSNPVQLKDWSTSHRDTAGEKFDKVSSVED